MTTCTDLVREAPIGRLMPNPEKDGFLPKEVTVNFDDGVCAAID